MRAELKRLHHRLGITTIYVTHDQVEAMTLGDRIAVMSNGRLHQLGPPQDVYDHPTNLFVAGFIGSPPMNLLRGTAVGGRIQVGDLRLELAGIPDGDVVVGLRPESLGPARDGRPSMEFEIDVVEPLGDEVVVHGTVAGQLAESGAEEAEERELLPLAPGSRAVITARFDPRVRPKPGERMLLGVDLEKAHLFDARTGAAIR